MMIERIRLFAGSILMCFLVCSLAAFSQKQTVTAPATTPPASLTGEECLTRVRGFEPTLQRLQESCKFSRTILEKRRR